MYIYMQSSITICHSEITCSEQCNDCQQLSKNCFPLCTIRIHPIVCVNAQSLDQISVFFLSVCRNVVFPFVFLLLAIRFSICFSCFCWQWWVLSVFHFGFCEVFFGYLFTLFLNVKFWCNLLYFPFLDKTKKGKKNVHCKFRNYL